MLSDLKKSVRKILRISRKPTKEEIRLSLRITILGVIALGTYAFIFEFVLGIIISLLRMR